jgi:hypothetical protein
MTATTAERAEALFVSCLQGSQTYTAEEIRKAVDEMLERLGATGCAARLAQEYGEHPDEAMRRMHWVLATTKATFPETHLPQE